MLTLLLACGYGPKTTLAQLEPEHRLKLCEGYAITEPVDLDCGSPIPLTVVPLDAQLCADVWLPDDCDVTVREWEACQAAIDANPCTLRTGDPACDGLEQCGVHLWAASLGLRGDKHFQEMDEVDLVAVCEVTNDFEAFTMSCDQDPPVVFNPDPNLCIRFGFGGCGTIADVLECQDALFGFEQLCDDVFPPECSFTDC